MNSSEITPKNNWLISDFILREKISETPFSTVWKANHRNNPDFKDVALKKITLSKLTPNLKASLDCEIHFLSTVNHPNIIRLMGFFQAEGCLFLVYEFCNGGNLASYIHRHGGVQEQIARDFMYQLRDGLRIMRSHQIVHRDLKPQNILLSSCDSRTLLKIADFGLSRVLHSGDYAVTVCGSPLYMAPEMLGFQRYDDKLLKNIKASKGLPFSQLILQKIHPDCFDMCSRLLYVNPANRLSVEEIYCHRFFVQTKEGL
ncbi:serine/threonine-protein kinase ATG1t isoform X2 [Spinacia oleracea]|uniref:Serine/threonine-protein kinase ATG1t isoform X2 n=1 Tax=Spinacia oleracea TaxID=3562 RepID=A0A9R0HQL4_SPIOL|nr:serine/threonine-protein kinase ATG1t isoform X2 [Spinacia oleracea]